MLERIDVQLLNVNVCALGEPVPEGLEQRGSTGIAGFLERHRGLGVTAAQQCGAQGQQRGARYREHLPLAIRRHDHVSPRYLRRRLSSASSITSTPRLRAFSSLLPAASPARTKLVFFDTLSATRPPDC